MTVVRIHLGWHTRSGPIYYCYTVLKISVRVEVNRIIEMTVSNSYKHSHMIPSHYNALVNFHTIYDIVENELHHSVNFVSLNK